MPTVAELKELENNCTSQWTMLNGVSGQKFTSKKNGNSIFLPAAGFRYDTDIEGVGSDANYFSSSLDHTSSGAYGLHFTSYSEYCDYEFGRDVGLSIRPVSK